MTIYQDDIETLCGAISTLATARRDYGGPYEENIDADINAEIELLKRILYKTLKAKME